MFDDTVAAVALLAGPHHQLLYTNAACTRMLGARRLGAPAREAFAEPDAAHFLTVLDEVRATGRPRQLTDSREPDPGAPDQARHFVYSCSPVTTPAGPGILVVTMDTTAETRALQRYEALVSAVTQMVWVMHPDGAMDEIVSGWEQLTGTPWHPRADESWYERIHPRDREGLLRAWQSAAEEGTPSVFQASFRVRTADGSYRHMSTRGVPVMREGRVAEWIAATADIEATWGARLRERLLAQVAAVSGASLDEAFAEVVNVVVPELADACLILLLSHDQWPLPDHARVTARRVASATRPGLPAPPALRNQQVVVSPAIREVLDQRTPAPSASPPAAHSGGPGSGGHRAMARRGRRDQPDPHPPDRRRHRPRLRRHQQQRRHPRARPRRDRPAARTPPPRPPAHPKGPRPPACPPHRPEPPARPPHRAAAGARRGSRGLLPAGQLRERDRRGLV